MTNKFPFIQERNDHILINIYVKPNSKRQKIRIEGDKLIAELMSPPKEGKANKELVKLLSKLLGIPKSHISIIKGEKSREKTLRIEKSREIDYNRFLDIDS